MRNITKIIRNYLSNRHNWHIAIALTIGVVAAEVLVGLQSIRDSLFVDVFANSIATMTGLMVDLAGFPVTLNGSSLQFPGGNGVYFAFGCLGLRQVIWFAVFISIMNGRFWLKVSYILIGAIMIEFANVLRSVVIAVSNYTNPASFEIVHVQGTIWYVYGTVLYLWILWLWYCDEKVIERGCVSR